MSLWLHVLHTHGTGIMESQALEVVIDDLVDLGDSAWLWSSLCLPCKPVMVTRGLLTKHRADVVMELYCKLPAELRTTALSLVML